MKIQNFLIFCASLVIISGCSTFSRSPKRDFPSHIRNEVYGAMNYAEGIIKDIGVHRISPRSVTVQLVPGTRKIAGEWAFLYKDDYYPDGLWIYGVALNRGSLVQIAVDPNNPNNISISTLKHEMAHHWLTSNNHVDMHHYPIYDRYFEDWAYARKVTGLGKIQEIKILHISHKTANDYISIHAIEVDDE